MKHEAIKVSGAFLRQSISDIKRIRRGNYTQEKHNKKLYLEDKAEEYFDLYMNDSLVVDSRNKEAFAIYIDEFAGAQKELLLDKLQKEASFDVRKYLETYSLSLWQRMFPKKKKLSSAKMNKKIIKYTELRNMLNKDGFHGTEYVNKFYELADEASEYITAYNRGDFTPEDTELFKSYVKTLGNFYEGSPASEALDKLNKTPTEKMPIKAKTISLKNVSFGKKWIKYAAVGAFATVIGWLGLKSDSNAKDPMKPVTEAKTTPVEQNQNKDAGVNVWQSFAQKHHAKTEYSGKQTAVNLLSDSHFAWQPVMSISSDMNKVAPLSEENQLNQKQKDMKPFYAKRLAQFTSKKQAEKMISDFAKKVDTGIMSLPEDISMNRFLYAQRIYYEYGFKDISNEFRAAINADKPVSKQVQEKLFKYVRDAGDKGVGVQEKAQNFKFKNLKQLRDSRYK